MFGQPNAQLAYEISVEEGSLPPIAWKPEPDPALPPVIADRIARFQALFSRSRFDADRPPIAIVTPVRPEMVSSIDFVHDYRGQPEAIPAIQRQINAAQDRLADYRRTGLGLPAGNPFDGVSSPFTGLPTFVTAGITLSSLTENAVQQQAQNWLNSHGPVITGLDQWGENQLRLVQTQGISAPGQPGDIIQLNYQQQFRGYPVYGAQVALHIAANGDAGAQRPANVTSSFFPIPDVQFTQSIPPDQAIQAAEHALAAYRSGPDALRALGETLASPAGEDLFARLENFASARHAALEAKDELIVEFTGIDPTLRAQGLPELLNRAWNRQEGEVWAAPAWWNKPQFPDASLDTALIGDLLAPPRQNHHDLLSIAQPDLQPWLEQPITEVSPMPFLQIKAYDDARLAATHALGQVRNWFADNHIPGEDQTALATIVETWAERDELGTPTWDAHIAEYEGSKLLVLPFAGRYYLVYLVELLTPARDEGWRVFVNAESGPEHDLHRIVGRPEALSMHFDMRYYASSQAALGNQRVDMTNAEIAQITADLTPLARLKFHPDSGGGEFTMPGLTADTGLPLDRHREGMNIAFHAHKFYRFFLDRCRVNELDLWKWYRDAGRQGPPLEIQAGQQGTELTTGFVPSSATYAGVITFQTDTGNGLIAEGGTKVYNPSRDPELVYHEMAHALMWLLNRVPFDNRLDSVPFGRALLEGYANYLARSLAARVDPGTGQWALASYRDGDWHRRWSVTVPAAAPQSVLVTARDGIGALAAPNHYPEAKATGLAIYDVGMVWTRALWDIRDYLSGQADVGDGLALADYLAMQSYRCVLGWSASFEVAAEGLIAAARSALPQIAGLSSARQKVIIKALQEKFMGRGILAERGVQAIGQASSGGGVQWLAGADSGLRMSADPTLSWANWSQITDDSGNALAGVTDLLVDGNIVYIATETGIVRWDAASGAHRAGKVGTNTWTAEAPRCLAIVRGQLVAGTNRSLWRFDAPGSSWVPWVAAGIELKLIASRIVSTTIGGRDFCLVSAPDGIRYTGFSAAAPNWGLLDFQNSQNQAVNLGWITSMAGLGNRLYLATMSQGVRPVQLSVTNNLLNATVAPALPTDNAGIGKVLRLAHDGNQTLYAGTTTGLFQSVASGQWARVANSPPGVATVVLSLGQAVAAGTAVGGVWIQRPTASGPEVVRVDTEV